ncbi:MAG: GerMN domain-containing protein [bacterium]|nr:GerMN domain-containing protein [bacterium]
MKKSRWFFLILFLAGAGAAVYYADPIFDLIYSGRRAALDPAQHAESGLAAPLDVVLFFAGGEGEKLLRYPTKVEKGKNIQETLRNTLNALLAGPEKEGFAPVFPKGTTLRAVTPDPEGVVYVDLSRAVREAHPGGAWGELLTAYAIANTVLFNFRDSFEKVILLIDGQEAETIAGAYSVTGPMRYREDLVAEEPAEKKEKETAKTPPSVPAAPPAPAGTPGGTPPPVGTPGEGAPPAETPPPGAPAPPAGESPGVPPVGAPGRP